MMGAEECNFNKVTQHVNKKRKGKTRLSVDKVEEILTSALWWNFCPHEEFEIYEYDKDIPMDCELHHKCKGVAYGRGKCIIHGVHTRCQLSTIY